MNGGGWAHYVGQEKCRPVTGWTTLASALDWARPPRQMIQTAYWYLHTDQWRYDQTTLDGFASPLGEGRFDGKTPADVLAQSARMGWMPSIPTFNRNPLDLADEAAAAGKEPGEHVIDGLRDGSLRFAAEDPDAPENFPRVLTIWRANLLGSSAKGNEYFLKHLLGADSAVRAEEAPPEARPKDLVWREEAPTGKLDLLLALDFRMTSTTIYSDITLPAATWYEKHDLNTTDMHPYVHSFNPAIAPPWETRTDFDAFGTIARQFSRLAATHLGVRKDLMALPLMHDTPDEMANPRGVVRDWKAGECDPIPGHDDAEVRRPGAGLRGRRAEVVGPRAAGGEARPDDQGRHHHAGRGGRVPQAQERRHPRRRRGRAGRRWPGTCTGARRSSRCRGRRTGGWRPRASTGPRNAPACGWPTWPPSTRAS